MIQCGLAVTTYGVLNRLNPWIIINFGQFDKLIASKLLISHRSMKKLVVI